MNETANISEPPNLPRRSTVRLTTAQALVRYLAGLRTRVEGPQGDEIVPLFGGVFAIFGHGNVAALGEALYQNRDRLPTYRAHNEQAMAHAAIAYAKAHFRRRMMACTSSVGPEQRTFPANLSARRMLPTCAEKNIRNAKHGEIYESGHQTQKELPRNRLRDSAVGWMALC